MDNSYARGYRDLIFGIYVQYALKIFLIFILYVFKHLVIVISNRLRL
jgi:hypothetical protein